MKLFFISAVSTYDSDTMNAIFRENITFLRFSQFLCNCIVFYENSIKCYEIL